MKALAALVIAVLLSAPMGAQERGRITGVVQNDSGRPLAGADVALRSLDRRTRTDSAGHFELADIPAGNQLLHVRQLGYDPRQVDVSVRGGAASQTTILLTRRKVVLDTVVVVGATCAPTAYQGFLCRRKNNRGLFLDFPAIDSLDAGNNGTGDLFRGLKGFRVDTDARGTKYPVATGGYGCLVSVVNGHEASRANPIPAQLDEIIGVEIYASPNDIPEPYQRMMWIPPRGGYPSRRCSMVVYWTD